MKTYPYLALCGMNKPRPIILPPPRYVLYPGGLLKPCYSDEEYEKSGAEADRQAKQLFRFMMGGLGFVAISVIVLFFHLPK